jgi:hypothetical protein
MAIPVLSWATSAASWLWNKIRGRPTAHADRGAVAAGGDQHIAGSVVTGASAVVVHRGDSGLTIVAQKGAIVYINAAMRDPQVIQKAGKMKDVPEAGQMAE